MELKGSKTEMNLLAAFAGESQARNKYTYYASQAKKDGYEQIAAIFEETANNEKEHEERYNTLTKNIEDYIVFKRDGKTYWQCRNCGHIVEAEEAPKMCPVCAHPQSFFEMWKVNY